MDGALQTQGIDLACDRLGCRQGANLQTIKISEKAVSVSEQNCISIQVIQLSYDRPGSRCSRPLFSISNMLANFQEISLLADSQMHSTPDAHAYEEPNPNYTYHAVLKYHSSDICTDKSASQRLCQSAHARQCRHLPSRSNLEL
jgi:hypothetical protein